MMVPCNRCVYVYTFYVCHELMISCASVTYIRVGMPLYTYDMLLYTYDMPLYTYHHAVLTCFYIDSMCHELTMSNELRTRI